MSIKKKDKEREEKKDRIIESIGRWVLTIFFLVLGLSFFSSGISENTDIRNGNIDVVTVTAKEHVTIRHTENDGRRSDSNYTKCRAKNGDMYIIGGTEPIGDTFKIYKPKSSDDHWGRMPDDNEYSIDRTQGAFGIAVGGIMLVITVAVIIGRICKGAKKIIKRNDPDPETLETEDDKDEDIEKGKAIQEKAEEGSEQSRLDEALNMAASAAITAVTMFLVVAQVIIFGSDVYNITELEGLGIVAACIAAWFICGFIIARIMNVVGKHIAAKHDISSKAGEHQDSDVMKISHTIYIISIIALITFIIIIPCIGAFYAKYLAMYY